GTTRAGQPGFDWSTLRLIWPSNFGGGGGRYRPSIVVVASGEPGTPVVCCAAAGADMVAPTNKATSPRRMFLFVLTGATPLLLTLEGNPRTSESVRYAVSANARSRTIAIPCRIRSNPE